MKKTKVFNKKAFIIAQLRRASYKYPPRNEALKRARVDRGQYQCNICGPGKTYDRYSIAVDHIIPVVDPEKGFETWEEFINRMFCEVDGFQILCLNHHKEKTQGENTIRKQTRAEANAKKRIKRKKAQEKANPLLKKGLDELLSEFKITKKVKKK